MAFLKQPEGFGHGFGGALAAQQGAAAEIGIVGIDGVGRFAGAGQLFFALRDLQGADEGDESLVLQVEDLTRGAAGLACQKAAALLAGGIHGDDDGDPVAGYGDAGPDQEGDAQAARDFGVVLQRHGGVVGADRGDIYVFQPGEFGGQGFHHAIGQVLLRIVADEFGGQHGQGVPGVAGHGIFRGAEDPLARDGDGEGQSDGEHRDQAEDAPAGGGFGDLDADGGGADFRRGRHAHGRAGCAGRNAGEGRGVLRVQIVEDFARALIAFGGVFLQALENDVGEVVRHLREDGPRIPGGRGDPLVHELHGAISPRKGMSAVNISYTMRPREYRSAR